MKCENSEAVGSGGCSEKNRKRKGQRVIEYSQMGCVTGRDEWKPRRHPSLEADPCSRGT